MLDLVEDITANVVKALALDGRRRSADNRRLTIWPLRRALSTFAGTEGTRYPTLLRSGRLRYLRFVLRKPEQAVPMPSQESNPPPAEKLPVAASALRP
jgi:hypothetical protein